MEKSILFFDIDGTLVDDATKEIPKSVIKALEMARENGHLTFINTGRTKCSITKELRELPIDGFLCGCGIYLTYHDEVLFESHLPQERADYLAKKMMELNIEGLLEGRDDVYLSSKRSNFPILESMRDFVESWGLGKSLFYDRDSCPFDKMYVGDRKDGNMEKFFDIIKDDLDVIPRESDTYECIQKGLSKATAIEMMLKHFNIDIENAYVFGDSGNDLPMFKCAKHAIAMEEHNPVLDPYTEYVTKKVMDDGIYLAMKHYGLI